MKKSIFSLCIAFTAALTLIGCNKTADTRVDVAGVSISTLDGHKFEKTEMMGKTVYVATLDPKGGFAANVNILLDEIKGTLPELDEYLKLSMSQYQTFGAKVQVQDKTESATMISGSMGELKLYQRVFRDSAKNRFIVVTGTYKEDSDKAIIEKCVDNAEL